MQEKQGNYKKNPDGTFAKGNRGGPGRNPLNSEFRQAAREKSEKALEVLYSIMLDEKITNKGILLTSASDRIRAAQIIIEHGWGKPPQQVEIDDVPQQDRKFVVQFVDAKDED